MALATLSIDLIAKTAQLERDMREAANIGRKGAEQIQESLEGLKTYASGFLLKMGAGMAAAFASGAVLNWVNANADAADELNRLSQQTGISVDALSAWGNVARRNGQDVNDLAELTTELSLRLAEIDKDSEGAGLALKQLGLDYKQLAAMPADKAFEAVAKAVASTEDSGRKTALVMAAMGDEAQKYITTLNTIGAAGEMEASITTRQGEVARDYKDALAKLNAAGVDWSQTVVSAMLPTFRDVILALDDAIAGTGGLTGESRRLARDGTIAEWANGTAYLLSYVSDLFQYTGRAAFLMLSTIDTAIRQVMLPVIGAMDAAAKAMTGDFAGAGEALSNGFGAAAERSQQWVGDMRGALDDTLGTSIRARISETERLGKAGEDAAKKVDKPRNSVANKSLVKQDDKDAKKREDEAKKLADAQQKALEEYEKLVTGIRTKTAADEAEAAGLAPLTDAQRSALEVMTQIRDGRLKLTETQKVNVTGYLEEAIAAEKAAEGAKAYTAWMDESRNANADTLDQAIQQTAAIRDQLAALHLQAEEYGLSAEGVTALAQARKLDTARALESSAAAMAGLPGYERMTAEWQAQADAIRDVIKQQQIRIDLEGMDAKDPYKGARQGIKDYLKDISAASDAAKSVTTKMLGSVEDELTSLVTTGQFNWKSLINSMISEALRLSVVRPMMSAFLDSSAGSSPASLIGNMVSVGASFFGGVGSAGNAGYGDYSSAGLAAAFGGGRANGGPVGAGTLYDVNERGTPELLTVGSKTMLMMGAEGGRVTPLDNLQPLSGSSSAGASAPVIHQTFNFGGADTVTRAEMQRAAAAAKDAALSEWQNNRARGVRGYA